MCCLIACWDHYFFSRFAQIVMAIYAHICFTFFDLSNLPKSMIYFPSLIKLTDQILFIAPVRAKYNLLEQILLRAQKAEFFDPKQTFP